jgi:hypothetical protein
MLSDVLVYQFRQLFCVMRLRFDKQLIPKLYLQAVRFPHFYRIIASWYSCSSYQIYDAYEPAYAGLACNR